MHAERFVVVWELALELGRGGQGSVRCSGSVGDALAEEANRWWREYRTAYHLGGRGERIWSDEAFIDAPLITAIAIRQASSLQWSVEVWFRLRGYGVTASLQVTRS